MTSPAQLIRLTHIIWRQRPAWHVHHARPVAIPKRSLCRVAQAVMPVSCGGVGGAPVLMQGREARRPGTTQYSFW